jgi:hypothetical protein
MVTEVNEAAVRGLIIESLCDVRDADRADIDTEIAAHENDLRIDSKEGEAICIDVEDALGLGELVEASDLKPEELTSISSLTRLFMGRIAEQAVAGKDAA